jgi:hypothetical protein
MPKYLRFFLKKCSNNFKDFWPYTRKKDSNCLLFFYFLGFVWEKVIFLYNEILKTWIRRCFPNAKHTLKQKKIL